MRIQYMILVAMDEKLIYNSEFHLLTYMVFSICYRKNTHSFA